MFYMAFDRQHNFDHASTAWLSEMFLHGLVFKRVCDAAVFVALTPSAWAWIGLRLTVHQIGDDVFLALPVRQAERCPYHGLIMVSCN